MKKITSIILALITIFVASIIGFATKNEQRYTFSVAEKTDENYVKKGSIDKNDPHSGWELGSFVISGYTRKQDNDKKNIFLKNVGDKITLSFNLKQNIDALNGDSSKCIAYIKDGYDKNYDFSEAMFGRGLLLVKHKNYQGETNLTEYTDYLSGKKVGANTKIEVFEEGDYEVTLDYCIADGKTVFNIDHIIDHKILPSYDYYRMHFSFSVRNGNCMVYPFDVKTKSELTNSSFTENGFYLDLAKSRYLNIDVKKLVLNTNKDGLSEDARFNKPVCDGTEFTEEGIYIITVKNTYAKLETTKTIYVGKNNVLKAYATYATTGMTISQINALVNKGATINSDGTINEIVAEIIPDESETELQTEQVDEFNITENINNESNIYKVFPVIVVIILAVIFIFRKKKQKKSQTVATTDQFVDIYIHSDGGNE